MSTKTSAAIRGASSLHLDTRSPPSRLSSRRSPSAWSSRRSEPPARSRRRSILEPPEAAASASLERALSLLRLGKETQEKPDDDPEHHERAFDEHHPAARPRVGQRVAVVIGVGRPEEDLRKNERDEPHDEHVAELPRRR